MGGDAPDRTRRYCGACPAELPATPVGTSA